MQVRLELSRDAHGVVRAEWPGRKELTWERRPVE